MNALYDTIHLIEKLHRHFLHVLKIELDKEGLRDITNVQSLILYNIGDKEMSVGELTTRGYYLGSNVSYNVKRMVENGYLDQRRSPYDRRSTTLALSEKGVQVRDFVQRLLDQQVSGLEQFGVDGEELVRVNELLLQLQRFWGERTDLTDLIKAA